MYFKQKNKRHFVNVLFLVLVLTSNIFVTRISAQSNVLLNDSLFIAAKNGNPQKVNELLSRGANINATDGSGSTALMYASLNGQINIVNVLN